MSFEKTQIMTQPQVMGGGWDTALRQPKPLCMTESTLCPPPPKKGLKKLTFTAKETWQ